eukprot:TRINITY_DN3354_c0_g1_i1.p1 TRINITY_DN3354_c0_g1~~TRINITY_DN3354_c0_g1_i1.p1  ORF type:complete len:293 (-),score=20.82 TRINITY_DN3354_c0_g1_i1:38-802(-)
MSTEEKSALLPACSAVEQFIDTDKLEESDNLFEMVGCSTHIDVLGMQFGYKPSHDVTWGPGETYKQRSKAAQEAPLKFISEPKSRQATAPVLVEDESFQVPTSFPEPEWAVPTTLYRHSDYVLEGYNFWIMEVLKRRLSDSEKVINKDLINVAAYVIKMIETRPAFVKTIRDQVPRTPSKPIAPKMSKTPLPNLQSLMSPFTPQEEFQDPRKYCEQCLHTPKYLKWCKDCKKVRYCGRDCQFKAWKEHKKVCGL